MGTRFLRFKDLVALGIVANRVTLGRWIKLQGFPAGIKLGPNSRAWPADQVDDWLNARPAETEEAS